MCCLPRKGNRTYGIVSIVTLFKGEPVQHLRIVPRYEQKGRQKSNMESVIRFWNPSGSSYRSNQEEGCDVEMPT